jgi:hypothetical protein
LIPARMDDMSQLTGNHPWMQNAATGLVARKLRGACRPNPSMIGLT